MGNRQQIQEIPGALRTTLEKARTEFGAVIRKVRWADGSIYVCGAGEAADLGVAASYAFETFPGWPVVARPMEVFQTYALPLLRARSVLLMISGGGEEPEAQELAHTAHQRNCTVVALANSPDSALVKVADHILLTGAVGDAPSPAAAICLHAALNYLAFEAARILKRPEPQWSALEEEFALLPEKMDWVFTQLPSVVRSMAAEVADLSELHIVGGGFYHYPALHAARRMQPLPRPRAGVLEASELLSNCDHFGRSGQTLLFLSGSHSKIKKVIHRGAAQARENGARVLSLTDSNDRDLVEGSDLGILIPSMLEAPASTLTLFMLEWLAMEASRTAQPSSAAK